MHSGRMRTTRLLTVSHNALLRGEYLPGGCTCLGSVPAQGGVSARGCTWQGVYLPQGYLPRSVPVGRYTCPFTE